MDSDPDETVLHLRKERFELLDDLHRINFRGVDEFARFLETTHDDEAHAQIPKLRRQKHRMQLLKKRLIERSTTSSFAQSPMGPWHGVICRMGRTSAFARKHTQFIASASTVLPSTGIGVHLLVDCT